MKQKKESKVWGISSLVTAILSLLLFLMPYFGLPLAIFSLVAYGMQKQKNGFATAGLVVGIISLIINAMTGFIGLIFGMFMMAV